MCGVLIHEHRPNPWWVGFVGWADCIILPMKLRRRRRSDGELRSRARSPWPISLRIRILSLSCHVSGGPRRSRHGAACSGRKALAGVPDNQEDAEEEDAEQRNYVVYLFVGGGGHLSPPPGAAPLQLFYISAVIHRRKVADTHDSSRSRRRSHSTRLLI